MSKWDYRSDTKAELGHNEFRLGREQEETQIILVQRQLGPD